MCTTDNGTIPAFVVGLTDDTNIETIVFTTALVKASIKKLKLGGASGPDGLPAHRLSHFR